MSHFLDRYINDKKNISISVMTVMIIAFLFGFFYYSYSSQYIKDFFQNLFYINHEKYTNQYQLYFVQNILYMIISTYLSSSYFGQFGVLFLVFMKGLQLSFSLIYVFSIVEINILLIIILIIEMIMEIGFVIINSYFSIYLSSYVTLLTFYLEKNFNFKNMMNYLLNYFIIALILFSVTLAFRVYIVPLF